MTYNSVCDTNCMYCMKVNSYLCYDEDVRILLKLLGEIFIYVLLSFIFPCAAVSLIQGTVNIIVAAFAEPKYEGAPGLLNLDKCPIGHEIARTRNDCFR